MSVIFMEYTNIPFRIENPYGFYFRSSNQNIIVLDEYKSHYHIDFDNFDILPNMVCVVTNVKIFISVNFENNQYYEL